MVVRCLVACALVLTGCRFGFGRSGADAGTGDGDLDEADAAPVDLDAVTLDVVTFSTASTTFVQFATVDLPAATDISWLVLTSAQLASTVGAGFTVEARYLLDGVERGMGGTENSVASRAGPWQHVDVIEATGVAQRLSYELRDGNAATATITNLHVVAIPLRPTVIRHARVDAIRPITAPPTTKEGIDLALGALDGDYLFFLNLNLSDAPGLSDAYCEWYAPDGSLWMTETHQPREAWQSLFWLQRATLTSADARVKLSLWTDDQVGGQVQYARAVAVRADAFASVDLARDDGLMLTSANTPTQAVQITPGSGAIARSYVAVSSVRLSENCSSVPDAERSAYTTIDAMTTTIVHTTDNCAYAATYGEVRTLASRPTNMAAGYLSSNSLPVLYEGAQLLLLGLP